MMSYIRLPTVLLALLPSLLFAQAIPQLSLDTVLQRIALRNPQLKSYDYKAESFIARAEGAAAWMAPMVGLGTFMTPYPGQMVMGSADKGALMVQLEQEIPNGAKRRAQRDFIASQGAVETATKPVILNGYKSRAKWLYFNWVLNLQRIALLQQTEHILLTMKKIEEVRYPYNQSTLGNIFRAEARMEDNRNMVRIYEGENQKAKAWLNSLMNNEGDYSFMIDSAENLAFQSVNRFDTTELATQRKDIQKMDADINSKLLGIQSMALEKKPVFRVRLDHMSPFGKGMPFAYNVMGMVSIPIVPWSSKMYKQEMKAMQWEVVAMKQERTAMLTETQGMLYGMQAEINAMDQRIINLQTKVIPLLQRAFDAGYLVYQENKGSLTTLLADWEALSMMKMNVLDEIWKRTQMIINYEKEIFR